jgi:hypothetical protein
MKACFEESAAWHSFSAALNTLGLQSFTATDTVNAGFTGTESNIKVQSIQPVITVSGPANSIPGQKDGVPRSAIDLHFQRQPAGVTAGRCVYL